MKKLIIIMLIIFMVAAVYATTFISKDAAITYFESYKTDRESYIDSELKSIQYTSNKECIIDYDSEKPLCTICVKFTYRTDVYDNCVLLPSGTTEKEDELEIKMEIRRVIDNIEPLEEIKYTERNLLDKFINVVEATK